MPTFVKTVPLGTYFNETLIVKKNGIPFPLTGVEEVRAKLVKNDKTILTKACTIASSPEGKIALVLTEEETAVLDQKNGAGIEFELVYTVGSARASRTIQDLTFRAKTPGAGGNAITVSYSAGGALAVVVVGNAITITIEDGETTAEEIKAAVDASATAAVKVDVEIADGEDETPQEVVTEDNGNLSGGTPADETVVVVQMTGALNIQKRLGD